MKWHRIESKFNKEKRRWAHRKCGPEDPMRSKKLKSLGSSKRSEKIGYFDLRLFLEEEWLLVCINSSVWLLECLAEVEDKKEKLEGCVNRPHGYKVTLDDGRTWSRRKECKLNAKHLGYIKKWWQWKGGTNIGRTFRNR